MKPGERVLLSGSTVFLLNSFFDIRQVRRGVDQASVDPIWRQGLWEIREGEVYHDFVYPQKFEKIGSLQKVYEQNGDIIYKKNW